MTEATVSVIVPTYNSSGTLRLALQTVLCQDFADFEVWVVGDGCTDDSGEVIASLADQRLHWGNLSSNSGGPSVPRNEGLRRARGRFIAYLGHDDLWFPWHLSELIKSIETSDSDFAYSIGITIVPRGVVGAFTIPDRPRSPAANLSPSNWLHRKSLIEVSGSWLDQKGVGDDRAFLERARAARIRFAFCKQLSVLKFPSVQWRMYSLKTDFPQTKYVDSIRRDASKLRDELLLELATQMSAAESLLYAEKSSIYRNLRRVGTSALYLYGTNRWPANRLMNRRWRRRAGLARA
jgi:glycosyltransferase involved in cell wall biosynthesis